MTVASITTDIRFGPFIVPSNAQNMIMNSFAQRLGKKIEVVVPEPILSDELLTSLWLHNEFNFKTVFLCSIHQLPQSEDSLENICNSMSNTEFCFAIEGEIGSGADYLKRCAHEAKIFSTVQKIDDKGLNWLNFYELSKYHPTD